MSPVRAIPLANSAVSASSYQRQYAPRLANSSQPEIARTSTHKGIQTRLPAAGGATTLTYAVKAQVGGKLAQIGSRLIDGAAAKIADDFFARFSARLAPAVPIVTEEGIVVELASGQAPGSQRWVRYVSIAVILAIVVYLALRGFRF